MSHISSVDLGWPKNRRTPRGRTGTKYRVENIRITKDLRNRKDSPRLCRAIGRWLDIQIDTLRLVQKIERKKKKIERTVVFVRTFTPHVTNNVIANKVRESAYPTVSDISDSLVAI